MTTATTSATATLAHPSLPIKWRFEPRGTTVVVSRFAAGWLTSRFTTDVADARRMYAATRAAGFRKV